MKLAMIFDKRRPGTTGTYFERAFHTLGIACDHWWLRDAERIPSDYDLYLRVDHGDDYLVPLPARLRPAVFYAIDTHLAHSWKKIRRTAGWYDLVFCCHRDGAERLRGAEWLPVACDPELHGPTGRPPVWDVGFIGTEGGIPRKFYLQALKERYPNSRIGQAPYAEMASIYSRSRVGFNYSINNDVNMRLFEVLAARTLLVTNALAGDDLRRLDLEEGRHLATFRHPAELFERIDYFLQHPEEARQIAQAGHEAVIRQHTYAHRMRRLLARAAETVGLALPQALMVTG